MRGPGKERVKFLSSSSLRRIRCGAGVREVNRVVGRGAAESPAPLGAGGVGGAGGPEHQGGPE